MEDHRQHPRLLVRYLSTFSTGQRTAGEGVVLDLSLGGCRVESSTYVQLGTELGLCISLPNQVTPLAVDRAMVRWGRGHQFGLCFMSLRPEEQARLRRLVGSPSPEATHRY
ncbi:MAG TPA: PilZ domain-containing protein [Nitrospiraceae bacterium]|nr:PilZ domain-containing protein [Nitrospiraceae bacterium]